MQTRPVSNLNPEQQAAQAKANTPPAPQSAPNRPYIPGGAPGNPGNMPGGMPVPPYTGQGRPPVPQQRPPVPAPAPAAPAQQDVPVWALLWAIGMGAALALITIPAWVPVLGSSLLGSDQQVFWYLSRASAIVAFVLLWFSMASGLIISNKIARVWPGAFTAFDLHQFTSLLGLGFGVFHALILLGNHFVEYSLVQILVPFAGTGYRPVWVGLGQIGIYLSILVTFTFYIRKQIGNRLWHVIHYLSYGVFALVLLHGLLSGTDSGNVWVIWMYWLCGSSLLVLTLYRLAVARSEPARQPVIRSRG